MYQIAVDFTKGIGKVPFETISKPFYSILNDMYEHIDTTVKGTAKPIKFMCSLRTTYSNEIITKEGNPFFNCTNLYPVKHGLIESSILSAKRLFLESLDCRDTDNLGEDKLSHVVPLSDAFPVGAIMINDDVYVYVQIVLDESALDLPFFRLHDGYSFTPIQDIKPEGKLQEELLKTLRIIKGVNENE